MLIRGKERLRLEGMCRLSEKGERGAEDGKTLERGMGDKRVTRSLQIEKREDNNFSFL